MKRAFLYFWKASFTMCCLRTTSSGRSCAHHWKGVKGLGTNTLALQVMQAVARIDSQLIIFCQPDTIIERAAQAAGLPVLTLFLADRAYDDRGQLVPRGIAGSLIKEEAAVRARVRQFLQQGTVTTFSGNTLSIRARSILVHSDTPGSLALATLVRSEIEACGATVASAAEVLAQ